MIKRTRSDVAIVENIGVFPTITVDINKRPDDGKDDQRRTGRVIFVFSLMVLRSNRHLRCLAATTRPNRDSY